MINKQKIPYVRIVAEHYDAFFYLEDEDDLNIVKMILERVTKKEDKDSEKND